METVGQGRLYRLAKRLSIERLLRYLALWARYVWRGQSALVTRLRREPATDIAAQRQRLAAPTWQPPSAWPWPHGSRAILPMPGCKGQ